MKLCPRCGLQNYDNVPCCQRCGLPLVQQQPGYYLSRQQVPPAPNVVPDPVWKTILSVLGWIFIYPVMLTIRTVKKATAANIVSAAGSWIFYIALLFFTFSGLFAPEQQPVPTEQPVAALVDDIASTVEDLAAQTEINTNQPEPTEAEPVESPPEADTPVTAPSDISAMVIVNTLADAGLPISDITEYTAETDPNSLLGRPGQYIQKVNFADTTLDQTIQDLNGGSVEVFTSETDAQNRKTYIDSIGASMPMMVEYSYINGTVLLRLSKDMIPDQAAAYQSEFMK